MRHVRKLKGAFKGFAEKWGDHLTSDNITSQKGNMLGVSGDRDGQ